MSTALPTRQLTAAAAVVAGGAVVGALARWLIGEWWPSSGGGWPWALWWINVGGAALLGLVTGTLTERPLLAAGLGPGLLGGFTSVSAAAEEVRQMLAAGDLVLAGAWWGSMLVASVAAVAWTRRVVPSPGQDAAPGANP